MGTFLPPGVFSSALFSPPGSGQTLQNAAQSAITTLNTLNSQLGASGLTASQAQTDVSNAISSLRSDFVTPFGQNDPQAAQAFDSALRSYISGLAAVSDTLKVDAQLNVTPTTLLTTVTTNNTALVTGLGSFTSGTPTTAQALGLVQTAINGSLSNVAASLADLNTTVATQTSSTSTTSLLGNVLKDVQANLNSFDGSLFGLARTLPGLSGLSSTDAQTFLTTELTSLQSTLSSLSTSLTSLAGELPTAVPTSQSTQAQLAGNTLKGIATDLTTLSSNLATLQSNLTSSNTTQTAQLLSGLLQGTAGQVAGLASSLRWIGLTTGTGGGYTFSDTFFSDSGWVLGGYFGGPPQLF
jgi:hypothetical protein